MKLSSSSSFARPTMLGLPLLLLFLLSRINTTQGANHEVINHLFVNDETQDNSDLCAQDDYECCAQEFIDFAVLLDLEDIGSHDHPMVDDHEGCQVEYYASWNQIVSPVLSDYVLDITCVNDTTVEILFDIPPAPSMMDQMFPQESILLVPCDIEPMMDSDVETLGQGYLQIYHTDFDGTKATVSGMGASFDMLFQEESMKFDCEVMDPVHRRRLLELELAEAARSSNDTANPAATTTVAVATKQDSRDLLKLGRKIGTTRDLINTTLPIGDYGDMDIYAKAEIKGRIAYEHKFKWRKCGWLCVPDPTLTINATAVVNVNAEADFLFKFKHGEKLNLYNDTQDDFKKFAIPGASFFLTVPWYMRRKLKDIGARVKPKYGIGLQVSAPWFIDASLKLEAEFEVGAGMKYTLGEKAFQFLKVASLKKGINTTFVQTKDEPPSFEKKSLTLPKLDDIKAQSTLELFAGVKPQIHFDVSGLGNAVAGIKAGVSATASYKQNPPFLPVTGDATLPIKTDQCSDCHHVQLGLNAAVKKPFASYQVTGNVKKKIKVKPFKLVDLELMKICLWTLPYLPKDTCVAPPGTTPPPSRSPTLAPTLLPSPPKNNTSPTTSPTRAPTPVPTVKPIINDKEELEMAIDYWIFSDGTDTTYGPTINDWDVSRVLDFSGLFWNMTTFNDDISKWQTSQVTTMANMFTGASSFDQNINNWNVSSVEQMEYMFSFTPMDQPLGAWDVSNVVDFTGMFADSFFNQNISSWDIGSATSIAYMFNDAPFNQPLNGWDVSKVSQFDGTFSGSEFNQNINNWKVGSDDASSSMEQMFYGTPFNQPLNEWDVSDVTDFTRMFEHSLFNQDISTWNVGSATSMEYMFYATPFNQPLGGWNVSNVVDFLGTFADSSFNQNINNWNVGSATSMEYMFVGGDFNQPLGDWNVFQVLDFTGTFAESVFNQDISKWNVGSATSFGHMFFNSSSFNQNLCAWGDAMLPADDATELPTVTNMFDSSNCSVTTPEADLLSTPVTPLCHLCQDDDDASMITTTTTSPTISPVDDDILANATVTLDPRFRWGFQGKAQNVIDGDNQYEEFRKYPSTALGHCVVNTDFAPYVEIDLGIEPRRVSGVTIWHYWGDQRQYCSQALKVSIDGVNWTTIFDIGSDWGPYESPLGNHYELDSVQEVRYIRHSSGPSNLNNAVHFLRIEVDEAPPEIDDDENEDKSLRGSNNDDGANGDTITINREAYNSLVRDVTSLKDELEKVQRRLKDLPLS